MADFQTPKAQLLSVKLSAMRDLYDGDCQGDIVNLVEHAVRSLTNSVLVVPRQFFRPTGPGIRVKVLDLLDNSLDVFRRQVRNLFRGRLLDFNLVACHVALDP